MSKITYPLPAFAGQLTTHDRNRINALSRKAVRRGVTHAAFDIDEIIDSFDRKLFAKITQPRQCLHHLHYKLCVLVFKCKHSLAPAYLSEQLQQVAQLESRQRLRSSSSSAFVVPATRRSTLGDRSFSATGTRAWNSLPPTVSAASTLSSFRRYLKSHLFTKSFPS